MLDLSLLAFLGLIFAMGLRRPFIWVLAYLYIDIVGPQKIGWTIIQSIPVSFIAFLAAFGGWLVFDSKEGARFTFRQFLMVVLLAYCGWTTINAAFPEFAMIKWDWVWKALLFGIFLPLTLRTKTRLEAATLVMVLSAATIIINGGIKTVFGGGGYGTLSLLVNDNTGLYEGSIISCVAISVIPLTLHLMRHGTVFKPDWRVKLFAAGLIFSCLLMPIGTQARTGLVCIAVLAVLLLRTVKHRFLYMGFAGVALMASIPFLPQSFTERMETITSYDGDSSASTRLAVWKWTLNYVQEHPFGGGFDAYNANSFTYQLPVREGEGNNVSVTYQTVTDKARAYHSSYFEMLGEQGYPGLILWLWIQGLGVWQMERLRRRYSPEKGEKPNWKWSMADALQQAQIIYLVGSLFVGIAYQPFILMLVGLQCALWSYLNRVDKVAKPAFTPKARRQAPATIPAQ